MWYWVRSGQNLEEKTSPKPFKVHFRYTIHRRRQEIMAHTLSIAQNVACIRERIEKAAARSGRSPESITLMGVSKTIAPAYIQEAYEAGICVFGENRIQEFSGKCSQLTHLKGAQWRLIGHLQSNKVRKAAEIFDGVDSVDSLRLAEKLDQAGRELGKIFSILIEIKTSSEESKSGVTAGSPELEEILRGVSKLDHIKVTGLMTVPPYTEDQNGARPYFATIRNLRDTIAERKLPAIGMDVLSMGMSHDFEVAIEEGSTCVRVGTAIFGARPKIA
jgi:PLP dependent protein